jgi:hypothetical protein
MQSMSELILMFLFGMIGVALEVARVIFLVSVHRIFSVTPYFLQRSQSGVFLGWSNLRQVGQITCQPIFLWVPDPAFALVIMYPFPVTA